MFAHESYKFIKEFNSNTNLNMNNNYEAYENSMTLNDIQISNGNNKRNSYANIEQIHYENQPFKSKFLEYDNKKIKQIHNTNRTARNFHINSLIDAGNEKDEKNIEEIFINSHLNYNNNNNNDDEGLNIYRDKLQVNDNNPLNKKDLIESKDKFGVTNQLGINTLMKKLRETAKDLMKFKTLGNKLTTNLINKTDKPFISDRKINRNSRYDGLDLNQSIEIKKENKCEDIVTNQHNSSRNVDIFSKVNFRSNSIFNKLRENSNKIIDNEIRHSNSNNVNSDQLFNEYPISQNKNKILESKKILLFQSNNSSFVGTPVASRKVSTNILFKENTDNTITNCNNCLEKDSQLISNGIVADIIKDNRDKISPILQIRSYSEQESNKISSKNINNIQPIPYNQISSHDNLNNIPNNISVKIPQQHKHDNITKELKETIEIPLYSKENRLCKSEKDNPHELYKDESRYSNINNSRNYKRNPLITSLDVLNSTPNVTKVLSSDNKLNKLSLSNKYVHLFGDVIRIPKYKDSNKFNMNKSEDIGDITNLKSRKASANNSMRKDQLSENGGFNESFLKMSLDQSIIKENMKIATDYNMAVEEENIVQ